MMFPPEVQSILSKDEAFHTAQTKEENVANLLTLINHITANAQAGNPTSKKRSISAVSDTPSAVNVDAAVQSLRNAIRKQVKSQIIWKASCKTGKATWKYEGVCASADVFKALVKDDSMFKRKKVSAHEFETQILECPAMTLAKEIRYGTVLALHGEVTISFNANTLEFKFFGTYGK